MALYKDFNLSFKPDPITRDLSSIEGDDAVKQSVKNIVLTKLFDRVFRPSFGSEVNLSLFEPLDQVTCAVISRSIADAIKLFEPRVKLSTVDFYFDKTPAGQTLDSNTIFIQITFQILNSFNTMASTGVLLRRLR